MSKHRIVIEMDENGKVHIAGPLENRALCYGMLETAKEILFKRAMAARFDLEDQQPSRIVGAKKMPGMEMGEA